MRLVDDLIEPFRPLVDLGVYQLIKEGESKVNDETKRFLVRLMYQDMLTETGVTPLTVCTQKLAISLAQVFLGEREKLELPLPSEPFAM
jgi:CRISPR-associated protein Cas1